MKKTPESILEGRLPKLIVFDLDYTLWDLWIDTHAVGPLERNGDAINEVQDKYGETISFYPEVPQILRLLKDRSDVKLGVASRTHTPELAREALSLLLIPKTSDKKGPSAPVIGFFDRLEIYPGSKITHFQKLHKSFDIPYSEMLFFDDEMRNKEVEKKLGVTFTLVQRGTDWTTVEAGLKRWRERIAVAEEAS